ncbi:MAG: DedA family protein [Halobacteriales archaeon]
MSPELENSSTLQLRLRLWIEDYGLLVVAGGFLLLAVVAGILFVIGDTKFARELIDQYGLLALAFIFVLEGAMLLYFAPSEALVPAAIAILAKAPTGFNWGMIALIMIVAVTGATLGQTILFLLAQRAGREWLLEKPWFRISESQLNRFDRWFQRWGRPAVPVSNALLFTRGMLTVPAGVAEMNVREFVVLSAIGTFVFESWLAIGAYYAIEFGIFSTIVEALPL